MPDITYAKLAREVDALIKTVNRDAQALQNLTAEMSQEAHDTFRTAETIAAMFVDSATIAETRELGSHMSAQSNDAGAYATAANTTARAMTAAAEQNRDSHYDFGIAAQRSPVGSDIYSVDREWFRQE